MNIFLVLINFLCVVAFACTILYAWKEFKRQSAYNKHQMAELDYKFSIENEEMYTHIQSALSAIGKDREAILEAMIKNKGSRDRFSQEYIKEKYDIDHIGIAYIFFNETKDLEIKTYLKIKWAF